ncbi:arsenic transporter [Metabacillus sp. GX 13764]|uniref:arsenic transporter n=1 Tax=Metabacillus kandeliae TaxID=2900151 RepID=UPI001E401DFA|nr:arsenic transporter [Metabacillus kandeliae]MCD7035429.1 arsenic transporter [Metabacillus kandeliae]
MPDTALLMYFIFFLSVFFMMWRPRGLNETVPTAIGAFLAILLGIVPVLDLLKILDIVSGASITILSTIVMTIVLESIGFFRWVAFHLLTKAKGSGRLLFVYVLLISFLMTLFFNNDGSILITTPIIIQVLNMIKLKPHQKHAYLISGALIATASSAPIAVSNISNLIALKIVGLDLNSYVAMMFVPSMIGIITMAVLLYFYFRKDLPKKLEPGRTSGKTFPQYYQHPFSSDRDLSQGYDWWMFKVCISIVVMVRVCFFALTPLHVPIEYIAIAGALLIFAIRWFRYKQGAADILKKTPWHILIFAFSMYVLVYGLKNAGLNDLLVSQLKGFTASSGLGATMTMGLLLTLFSNLFNNLPAVMIGTLSLTQMNLDSSILQTAYLANVIGSDIGSLITPVGTLATLIWMFILKNSKVPIKWSQYLKVTIMVVPVGLIVSLLSLYFWTALMMK